MALALALYLQVSNKYPGTFLALLWVPLEDHQGHASGWSCVRARTRFRWRILTGGGGVAVLRRRRVRSLCQSPAALPGFLAWMTPTDGSQPILNPPRAKVLANLEVPLIS